MTDPSPTAMREERKIVTALFADVAGSTALGERIDPEDVRDIVGRAVGRIVEKVESFGGTVKDLAGDGALVLFGAPLAHEDDPERAVRAGLAIVEDIDRYSESVSRDWGIEGFGVRVGIETGLVVLGPMGAGGRVEYGATGDAVNTAARLQSRADLGTVLVGEETYRTVEALFEWSKPRSLVLKGKADPVIAWQAVAPRPSPGRTRGLGIDSVLVGRDRELETIRVAGEDLLHGRGGVLLVTGEAGLGKSRLLLELRRRLRSREVWLEGRCASYGEGVPYWPFRDLLHEWLGRPGGDVREALERAVAKYFGEERSAVLPFLQTVLGIEPKNAAPPILAGLFPESIRQGIAHAVGGLLLRLASSGPVVVALEDVHWADTASLQLAERLLPLADQASMMVVLAAREEEEHSSARLLKSARAPGTALEVHLDALPAGADRRLLVALVGEGTLPEPVERRLLGAAEGNPFYLEELVRSLVDAGSLRRGGAVWRFEHEVPLEVPSTVEKVILARLDRLPTSTREVLDAACVVGRRFDLPLVEAVAGGNGRVRAAVEDLVRLDLIRQESGGGAPEFRFKHVLIQEAAYRSLLRRRRREFHLRAAEALETGFSGRPEGQAAVLGHHFRAAGRSDRALEPLTRGAREARLTYANEEAVRLYGESVEVAQEAGAGTSEVAELRLERGEVRARTGDIQEAREDFEAALAGAREAGDRPLEMRALGELGFLLAGAADYRRGAEYLNEGLGLAEAIGDRVGQVSMLSRLCIVSTNLLRFDQAATYGERALALARAVGSERVVAGALDALKQVVLQLGEVARVAELANELSRIHERSGDLWLLQFVEFELAYVSIGIGRWEEALSGLRRSLEINRRIGDKGNEPLLLSAIGLYHAVRGDYDEALESGRRAVELATRVGHAEWTSFGELVLGATLLELHALEDADGHLERAARSADASGALLHLVRGAALLALCRWREGDPEQALRWMERAEDLMGQISTPPGGAYLPGWDAYASVARVRLASGDPSGARDLLEPVVTAAESLGWVDAIARGSSVLGRCEWALGSATEAERRLLRAADKARILEIPAAELEARTVLGVVYESGGRHAEAKLHRAAGRAILETLSGRIADESIRERFLSQALSELGEGSAP